MRDAPGAFTKETRFYVRSDLLLVVVEPRLVRKLGDQSAYTDNKCARRMSWLCIWFDRIETSLKLPLLTRSYVSNKMNSRMFLLFLFEVKVYENVKKLKIGMLALLARFASVTLKKNTRTIMVTVFG